MFIIDLIECLGIEIMEKYRRLLVCKVLSRAVLSNTNIMFFHNNSFSAMDCSRHNTSRMENAREIENRV